MNTDELNALRRIIELHGEVRAGEDLGSVIAIKQDPDAPRCGVDASLWCVFAATNSTTPCPVRKVESRVVASCTTGSPHVKKELIFVPKVEYLTWKLTQS